MNKFSPFRRAATAAGVALALAAGLLVASTVMSADASAAEECAPMSIAPFGDPGAAAATGTVSEGETICRTFEATPGRYLARYALDDVPGEEIYLRVMDNAGTQVCDFGDMQFGCALPVAGTYTVSVTYRLQETKPYVLSVVDVSATAGCAAEVGTGWNLPAVDVTLAKAVQLGCQPFSAVSGERIRMTFSSPENRQFRKWVLDANGEKACPDETGLSGCVLSGTAPYRLLSYHISGNVSSYRLNLGRLSNPVGCVQAPITAFGALPAAAPDGTRCRELRIEQPGRYFVDYGTYQQTNEWVYNGDGTRACESLGSCHLNAAGNYYLYPPEDVRLVFSAATSTNGCGQQGIDEFAAMRGDFSSGTRYDCLTLRAPAGATVLLALPLGARKVVGEVVDTTGAMVCNWYDWSGGSCKLTGTAPYRFVFRNNLESGPYSVAAPRIDQPSGCQAFPAGDFAAAHPVTAALGSAKFITCFAIPASAHSVAELLQLERGTGAADLEVVSSEASTACEIARAQDDRTVCRLKSGLGFTVMVRGDGGAAQHRLSRRDVTATAKGCVATPAGPVGGKDMASSLTSPLGAQCHRVTAATTDQVMLAVRHSAGNVRAEVIDPAGSARCLLTLERSCSLTGSSSYQVISGPQDRERQVGTFGVYARRLFSKGVPAPECLRPASTGYGFGPYSGQLTTTQAAICVQVQASVLDTFTGAKGAAVDVFGYSSRAYPDDRCQSYGESFSCSGPSETSERSPMVMVMALRHNATQASYQWSGTCAYPLCSGESVSASGVSPASAITGSTTSLTITGKNLHSSGTVQLTAVGKPAIKATVRAVSADHRTMAVTVNLAGAAAGPRDLTVATDKGTARLAGAFTVAPPRLRNTVAPSVVGTVRVAAVLKAGVGAWTPAATAYRYQWRYDEKAITGGTKSTYTVPTSLLGHRISVSVSALRTGWSNGSATSAAVVVAKGLAPRATTAPVISGTAKVRYTVKTSTGSWVPTCTAYGYQWYSGGRTIVGATKSSLLLTSTMAGKTLYAASVCHRTGHVAGRAVTKTVVVVP